MVSLLWSDAEAAGKGEVDLLVYRSRLLGADPSLVLAGAGNTSSKIEETDFRGERVRVLRIKASGADLAAATPADFPGLRLDALRALRRRPAMTDDEVLAWLGHCRMEPDGRRPSIETLLHAFLPAPHVDHTHADALLAVADTVGGAETVRRCFGDAAAWVPYCRPGFALARAAADAFDAAPEARLLVLDRHGLVVWGDGHRACHERTREACAQAAAFVADARRGRRIFAAAAPAADPVRRRALYVSVAPVLRGLLAVPARPVLTLADDEACLAFAGSAGAAAHAAMPPATPDHLMHVKSAALYVDGAPLERDALAARLREGVAAYRSRDAAYAARHGGAAGGGGPRIVVVPGLGVIASGRDARASRTAAEVYRHVIGVMEAAAILGGYRSLGEAECGAIEFWPLELYRQGLAVQRRELEGRVALVTGAAGGIGLAIAQRFAAEGALVAVADRDAAGAEAAAAAIGAAEGRERAIGIGMDVTQEADVDAGFDAVTAAWGGADIVVSNAGIAEAGAIDVLPAATWRRSLEVNATGHFLVTRAALRIMKAQGGGCLVFNASKNVPAPGKDFAAYSAAKAAETQLARVAALEGAPHGIRVNILHPDGIFRGSRLWSDEIRRERARAHGIAPGDVEDFYRRRNLMQVPIGAEDVAEAALFFASDRAAKITGAALGIDGGVAAAFPR